MDDMNKPWFDDGLRFKCTGCGKCCTGSPGYVYLSDLDIQNLSDHLGLATVEFTKKYTRLVDGRYCLLEDPVNFDCVFLKDNQCIAYSARPIQCKTFPWWIGNLQNPEDWEEAAKRCEGINHKDAPLVPSLEIQTQCMIYLDNLLEDNFS